MIIVNAKFYIKEDKKSQFLKEIEGLISASKKDEGCLEYSLYESTDNQLEFVMIEIRNHRKLSKNITLIPFC